MLYYTQLVFLKQDQAEMFHEFEDRVLPLLAAYGGQLLLRWRRTHGTVVQTAVGDPYEVHLIAFPTAEDFRNYVNDETRKSFLHLKDGSVERVLLIEGARLA